MLGLLETLKGTAAAVAAVGVLGSAAWGVGSYTDTRPALIRELKLTQAQLDQTNQSMLLLQFQLLDEKRQRQPLTWAELQQYCSIAKALGYVQVPGCGF